MLDPTKAATYERFRIPNSSFHTAKYEKIMKTVRNRKSLSVVEIGCGTGIYTRFLLNDFRKVVAIDNDPEMVENARKILPNAKVLVADAARMPFEDNSVFREAKRILRKGGFAVFCEPNILNPMTALTQLWYREPGLTPMKMKKYARKSGFSAVKSETVLLRSPGIAKITDKIPGWRLVEGAAEALNLGVSAFVVAQK
jgi:ubiquinone/menaquinone biosynthesis C-methylase UbiE